MKTWLITWNPNRWNWNHLEADIDSLHKHGFLDHKWSCGRNRQIVPGDLVFLLRQGKEPRGIIASGQVKSPPEFGPHWDIDRDDQALFIVVRFDSLIHPETDGVLPLTHLNDGPLAQVHWSTQSSGIIIETEAAIELETRWREFLATKGMSPVNTAEQVTTPELYYEGASRLISVNAYERDSRARRACIEYYGTGCSVCGFDFAERYGELGRGFIHVHHLVPLSEICKSYVVDPIKDLRPVCPNCHEMLHRGADVFTIEDLQQAMRK